MNYNKFSIRSGFRCVLTILLSVLPNYNALAMPIVPSVCSDSVVNGVTVNVVNIPDSGSSIPACTNASMAAGTIGKCINTLIAQKSPTAALRIKIGDGTYTMNETVFLYNNNMVGICGSNTSGAVTLALGASILPLDHLDKYFAFNVFDSNYVTISGLTLNSDSTSFSAQRGIAVCPTGRNALQNIRMDHLTANNFTYLFAILGRTLDESQMVAISNYSTSDTYITSRPTLLNLVTYLKNSANAAHRNCHGGVGNVTFEQNTLNLLDVGFYLTTYSVTDPSEVATTPDGGVVSLSNWPTLAEYYSQNSFNYNISNNNFIMAPKPSGQTQADNAMKLNGGKNIQIISNTIDSTNNAYTFAGGGAINLAYDLKNVSVSQNTIRFPSNHIAPDQGIAVTHHMACHPWFGMGVDGLTAPVRNLTINDNQLYGARIRLFDVCMKTPPASEMCPNPTLNPDLYCRDLELNQIPGNPKFLNLQLTSNYYSATISNVDIVSRDERAQAWLDDLIYPVPKPTTPTAAYGRNAMAGDRVGVFASGTLRVNTSGNRLDGTFNSFQAADQTYTLPIGSIIPVAGDWRGSGRVQVGYYDQALANFWLDLDGTGTYSKFQYGAVNDIPIVGDWNGDGKTKIGIYRPSTTKFYLDYLGDGHYDPTDRIYLFGVSGDIPVVGDWSGDGHTRIGVYRQSTTSYILDVVGNGLYDSTNATFHYGASTDKPIIGDWNGDGRSKVGVYRPSSSTFILDVQGLRAYHTDNPRFIYGAVGSIPFIWGKNSKSTYPW